jgi:hypothetical protein
VPGTSSEQIVIPRTASPSEVADVLAAHLSPGDLAVVAELLVDRLTDEGADIPTPEPVGT